MALAALVGCLVLAAPAVAKKEGGGKKGGGTVDITKTVNAPVPDRGPFPAPYGTLVSTIDVGKQGRCRQIRDVDVTVQTLGVTGANPADDLFARLTAPDGTNAYLFTFLGGYPGAPPISIGPLTLDDEALLDLGAGLPIDPSRLNVPWVGTAQPDQQLWPMDGGPARGTWTLHVLDVAPMGTSSLVLWKLHVTTSRPFLHK